MSRQPTKDDIYHLIPLLDHLSNPEILNSIPPDNPLMQAVMKSLTQDRQVGKLLWVPTPKQKLLVETPAYETLWGGARGGGKSFALLAIARNHHKRSLILRRNFAQLEGSLIDDSKRLFKKIDYYNVARHVWEFPDGCLIRFGHVQTNDDMYSYDGSQYDLLGIDQLEQFTFPVYQHLWAVVRTSDPHQRTRVICTANPVGENIDWIIQRWRPWIDRSCDHPAEPGELRWYARVDGKEVEVEDGQPFDYKGERIEPHSRTFIPALPADNPYLNKDYIATLQSLPEPLRSQLLYGQWRAGDLDDPTQVIRRSWVEAAMARWTEDNFYPHAPMALGVDVAQGGDDLTVLARCHRTWFDRLIVKPGAETPDGKSIVALVVGLLLQQNGGNVMIDMVGYGSSAFNQLRDLGYPVVGLNGGASPEGTDLSGQLVFANRRTEIYWKLREALDPANGIDLRLPPDEILKADLCSIHWEPVGGRIRVEPKEKVKERIGRSPDRADAVAYAWAMAQRTGHMRTKIIAASEYSIEDM